MTGKTTQVICKQFGPLKLLWNFLPAVDFFQAVLIMAIHRYSPKPVPLY
jgi:hypothetical protein